MALDKTRLKNSLKSKIIAKFGNPQPNDQYLDDYCLCLADAIVEEIQSHASVSIDYLDGQYNAGTNQDVSRTANNGTVS